MQCSCCMCIHPITPTLVWGWASCTTLRGPLLLACWTKGLSLVGSSLDGTRSAHVRAGSCILPVATNATAGRQ